MKKQEGKKQHFLSWEGKDGRRWLYKYFLFWQVCDLLNRSNMNVYWAKYPTAQWQLCHPHYCLAQFLVKTALDLQTKWWHVGWRETDTSLCVSGTWLGSLFSSEEQRNECTQSLQCRTEAQEKVTTSFFDVPATPKQTSDNYASIMFWCLFSLCVW